MATTRHEPEGRLWLLIAVCLLGAALALMVLDSGPEPCMDPNTTACAVPYQGPH